MIRPTQVEPRDGYRIWLRYQHRTMGEIDLSHLVGRGVFEAWNDRACFDAVRIAPTGGVVWGEDIELCPDALYMRLSGKAVKDVMPRPRALDTNACNQPFLRVIVRMHLDGHVPLRFHAADGGEEAVVGIDDLATLHGRLPPRACGLVFEWAARHQAELLRA